MKQYMLSVHHDEGAPTPTKEQMELAYAQTDRFNAEVQEAGAFVFCGGCSRRPPRRSSTPAPADR